MSRKQGKRNQRKQDKKRRAERAKRPTRQTPLAYTGNKYRTAELAETHLFTEAGIFHADIISRRQLTDPLVESALQQLILQLRHGPLAPLEKKDAIDYAVGQEQELIIENIRLNWQRLAAANALPGRDTLVGVLRSILGSVETWKAAGAKSRSYLEYIEDFLGQMGISAELVAEGQLDESLLEEGEEFDEEDLERSVETEIAEAFLAELAKNADLFRIGRAWYREGDPQLETLFRTIAQQRIDSGEGAEVAEICRQLIEESPRRSVNADLTALALQADRVLQPQHGNPETS